jgi:ribosome-binding protein aMBF1 (putative translation factor)
LKSFSELIRDGRKRAGLTQRELAARIMLDEGRPDVFAIFERSRTQPAQATKHISDKAVR